MDLIETVNNLKEKKRKMKNKKIFWIIIMIFSFLVATSDYKGLLIEE